MRAPVLSLEARHFLVLLPMRMVAMQKMTPDFQTDVWALAQTPLYVRSLLALAEFTLLALHRCFAYD